MNEKDFALLYGGEGEFYDTGLLLNLQLFIKKENPYAKPYGHLKYPTSTSTSMYLLGTVNTYIKVEFDIG